MLRRCAASSCARYHHHHNQTTTTTTTPLKRIRKGKRGPSFLIPTSSNCGYIIIRACVCDRRQRAQPTDDPMSTGFSTNHPSPQDATNNAIRPLSADAVHHIRTGQVIFDLTSAVKELVDNALDAGGTRINGTFVSSRDASERAGERDGLRVRCRLCDCDIVPYQNIHLRSVLSLFGTTNYSLSLTRLLSFCLFPLFSLKNTITLVVNPTTIHHSSSHLIPTHAHAHTIMRHHHHTQSVSLTAAWS